jgi:hypothetical protein
MKPSDCGVKHCCMLMLTLNPFDTPLVHPSALTLPPAVCPSIHLPSHRCLLFL